jgi:hypothetical protein
MRGHLDLKKSHFDPRNRVPDEQLFVTLVARSSTIAIMNEKDSTTAIYITLYNIIAIF